MGDDDAFVAAVKESPDDMVLRLVYADWLDERDDPRGRFLRLEVEMVERGESDPEYGALRRQLAEVAAVVDVRWHLAVCRVHVEPKPPFHDLRRHSLNVAGPFYTRGDCLFCGGPELEAPTLLAELNENNYTTHFLRQPETVSETEAACRASFICCVADVRYGGTDPLIIQRLGNTPTACDYLIDPNQPALTLASDGTPLSTPPQSEDGPVRLGENTDWLDEQIRHQLVAEDEPRQRAGRRWEWAYFALLVFFAIFAYRIVSLFLAYPTLWP